MSMSINYTDATSLSEEVSYHTQESSYHLRQFLLSKQEAAGHWAKFQEHSDTCTRLNNILKKELPHVL